MFVSSETKHFTFVRILFFLVFHKNCFSIHCFPLWIQQLLKVLGNFNRTWQAHSFEDRVPMGFMKASGQEERQIDPSRKSALWTQPCYWKKTVGNWHLNNSLSKTFYGSEFDSVSSWKITVAQLWKNMYLGTLLICFALISKQVVLLFQKECQTK